MLSAFVGLIIWSGCSGPGCRVQNFCKRPKTTMIPAGPLIAAYFSVAAVSLSLGYYTGTSKPSQSTHTATATKPEKSESESGEAYFLDDCKLVLAVRTDLGMTTGKIAAQCSHAVLACYKTLRAKDPALLRRWKGAIFVLRCADEDQLLTLQAQAQSLNLCARSIQDAGRTQIAAGSTTVLGVMGTWTECSFLTETLAVYL
ncbi:peptidyl-tRNA hydrolase PTH2-domain-containing protein [Mycena rebaudengoi]|nr:peptidyl-tRNA hydrolase PTH2-domain-containing protein [Mycena rebaudengoi]